MFIVEKGSTFTDNGTSKLALESDVRTPLQPFKQVKRTGLPALSLKEFIKGQAADIFCQIAAEEFGKAGAETTMNKERVFVRRAHIVGALQKLVPKSLRQRVFALPHYPQLSGHPQQRHMFHTIRRDYLWPNVAFDLYITVSCCEWCGRNSRNAKGRCRLQLFPATGLSKFVRMDVLGPLPKKTKGIQHISFITDHYSKLTQAIHTARMTTNAMAERFFYRSCVLIRYTSSFIER